MVGYGSRIDENVQKKKRTNYDGKEIKLSWCKRFIHLGKFLSKAIKMAVRIQNVSSRLELLTIQTGQFKINCFRTG
jgi:hypothetical protein